MRSFLKKAAVVLLAAVTSGMFLAGCTSLDRGDGVSDEETVNAGEPTGLESMDDLKAGHFYVYHDGKYYDPVWKETSFNTESSGVSTSNVAWFSGKNFGSIPTLYKGDYLVYFRDEAFNEQFTFNRYQDRGYTVGLCNLRKLSSGRFSFDAQPGSVNLAAGSDAARLAALNAQSVVIDSIGKAELRAGNVSPSGTIVGLKEGEYYTTEVYVGTELHTYTLCADMIALTGMESVRIADYTFLKNRIIRINIPNYLNSGYYSVNGSGIFRYVKGVSYDNTTDFNVPNDIRSASANGGDQSETKEFEEENDKEDSYVFTVRRESDVTVYVKYGEDDRPNFTYASPVVKVVGPEAVYTLSERGEREFNEELHLPAGRYRLVISEMDGRAYEYAVTAKGEE